MTAHTVQTIAALIADVGTPRNRAEQLIIQQMQRLDAEHARIQEVRDAGGCQTLAGMVLVQQQHGLWRAALELHAAVRAFREHSANPALAE